MVPLYDWGLQQPGFPVASPNTLYSPPPPLVDERPVGTLRLDLDGAGAILQLYVDGYFVGTPDEFNRELTLDAGPHRIEIRAPGYETIVFDVRIVADRSITYRGTLQRVAAESKPQVPQPASSQTAPPPSVPPSTFYFIPGCYIGNVPPEKVELPANCDMSRLITRKP
jgi:hypothetical protein